ncbi:MAG TPA: hypothetical protein VHU40_00485 [Polyangia bacterium]|jgi:hypothetical protein|nr:hypothetical protein [Polyangia bacterium]
MHTTTITAAGIAALLLTACSSGSPPTAKAKPTPSATSAEDKFVAAMAKADIKSWEDKGPSYDELHAYPKQWCAGLDEGHSVEWLLGDGGLYPIGEDWGTKIDDARKVLVLAVTAHCPEYRDEVTQELRESGEY